MSDLRKLIEAVEVGLPSPTHWSNFKACPDPVMAHLAYHGDLNAAKALHDALLPGWEWNIDAGDGAYVENRGDFGDMVPADIPGQPARSWLLAILRAKSAEGGE